MAHDVNLRHAQDLHGSTIVNVYLTDLGHEIIKHILPRQQKQIKRDTRRKGTARGRERERKRQLEVERALRQPEHWRNTVVDFIRPDGRIEAKDVGWCIDNKFKKVRSGKFTDAWAGNWNFKTALKTIMDREKHQEDEQRLENILAAMAEEEILLQFGLCDP